MNAWSALGGAFRFEFLMQIRRLALWIAMALLGTLVFLIGMQLATGQLGSRLYTHNSGVVEWAGACTTLLVLGAGLLLADRTRRDRSSKVFEMLSTTPAPLWTRLAGKYLGAAMATLVPIALIYTVGVVYLTIRWQDAAVLTVALVAFLALVAPPVFFVGAFSLACTTLLWTPLYQFLFVGYWIWNALNPAEAIPTLNNTLFSPTENYVVTGFFHLTTPYQTDALRYPQSSFLLGLANIAVLLACGAIALLSAWRILRRQDEGI
ncbi:MAG TPA: hypothetical protein VGP82_06685 [Ktedonobacterales bacterium]|jgi:ABC-type transport system involved in multi-copper enzyme maturation permease subunit|nr:hypothetical protein [Ktedonobacterales bacterium]